MFSTVAGGSRAGGFLGRLVRPLPDVWTHSGAGRGRSRGRWELIKINTEEYPEIAREHGIRSLPTIRLYVDGAAVGESLGVLPDADLQRWLARHLPSPHASELKAAGEALARGAAARPAASADRVLALEPENDEALWLKAQAALSLDPAGVPALLNAIPGGSPLESVPSPCVNWPPCCSSPPAKAAERTLVPRLSEPSGTSTGTRPVRPSLPARTRPRLRGPARRPCLETDFPVSRPTPRDHRTFPATLCEPALFLTKPRSSPGRTGPFPAFL